MKVGAVIAPEKRTPFEGSFLAKKRYRLLTKTLVAATIK
jgi:hypothetical protein